MNTSPVTTEKCPSAKPTQAFLDKPIIMPGDTFMVVGSYSKEECKFCQSAVARNLSYQTAQAVLLSAVQSGNWWCLEVILDKDPEVPEGEPLLN